MMNSPWATFTTFVTPQMRFSPWATTAKTQPSRMPYTRSWRTTDPASTIGPPGSRGSASGVRVLDRGHGDVRRVHDLQRAGLPLVHDHLVRGLDPLGVNLVRAKERHEMQAPQFRAHRACAEAVCIFDCFSQDEYRRGGFRGVVGGRGATRLVSIRRRELGGRRAE